MYVDDDNKQLAVMSLAFFLNTRNDAVIWRGPKKDSVYLCVIKYTCNGCIDLIIYDILQFALWSVQQL